MKHRLTVVTRKGQITLPIEIRRMLGIKEGDKVAISLVTSTQDAQPHAILTPVRSVAEMTFGAVRARKQPEDFGELRRRFEEGIAEEAFTEGWREHAGE